MKKRGFTLIELLVVIAIIGILAGIIIASTGTARRQARDSKRIADVNQILTALALFYMDTDGWPANLTPGASALEPDYMPRVPLDPDGVDYVLMTVVNSACVQTQDWDAAGSGPANTGEEGDIDPAALETIAGCDDTCDVDNYCMAVTP